MTSNSNSSGGLQTLVGVVAVVLLGVIAWFSSAYALGWLQGSVDAVGALTLSETILRIGVSIVLFVVLMMIFSFLLALAQPRDPQSANPADITRERNEMMADSRLRKGRSGARKREKR